MTTELTVKQYLTEIRRMLLLIDSELTKRRAVE